MNENISTLHVLSYICDRDDFRCHAVGLRGLIFRTWSSSCIVLNLLLCRKMERFLRAMESANQSQISLEILDSQKTVCSLRRRTTDRRQDNVELLPSSRLWCSIQDICSRMAVRNLRVHNLATKDLSCLQVIRMLRRMNRHLPLM